MWSDKYIVAHPEASPEAIKAKNAVIEKYQADLDAANRTRMEHDYAIQALKKELDASKQNLEDNLGLYQKLMGSGVGIGLGGLAFVGAGAALVATTDVAEFKLYDSKRPTYQENELYSMGWAFIGVGGALAITGAILTGGVGYKYNHYGASQRLSFGVSPTDAAIQFTF